MAHLPRPPSFDHGVTSFLWGFGMGFYLWIFLLAVGVSGGTSFILGVLLALATFLFVRVLGEPEFRKQG